MTIAYILAGGLGTRLRGVVSNVPKPMAPINGEPFLKLLLNFWIKQGITKFIISVGYLKDHIKIFFGNKYRGVSIEYFDEKIPLGTGGGLVIVSKKIQEDFVVINGDTFFEVSLKKLKDFKNKTNAGVVVSLFENENLDRYGQVIIDKLNWLVNIKKSKRKLSNLANGGVYLIDPKIINENSINYKKQCSIESDILPNLINQKLIVAGIKQKGRFLDIGTPSDYKRASNFFKIDK